MKDIDIQHALDKACRYAIHIMPYNAYKALIDIVHPDQRWLQNWDVTRDIDAEQCTR